MLKNKRYSSERKGNSDEVLDQVRSLFDEAEVTIPDAVLDRAHRVIKKTNDVIVRFTTFRHRTLIYRKRKSLKRKSVHLDLTRSRLQLLNDAKKVITNKDNILFCYLLLASACTKSYF